MSIKYKYSRTFFEQWLRTNTEKLGRWIGEAPVWCLVISVLVFGGFSLGLISMRFLPNLDGIRYVEDGPVLRASQEIDRLFPTNYSHFTPDRSVDARPAGVILLIAKNKGNILTPAALREVHWVHDVISKSKVAHPGTLRGTVPEYFTYYDVCAKWQGECFLAACLRIGRQGVQGRTPVRYPLSFDSDGQPIYLPPCLGTPTFKNGSDTAVASSSAIRLAYFADERDSIRSLKAEAWQSHFVDTVRSMPQKLNHTEMHYYSVAIRDDEVREMTNETMLGPTILVSISLLVVFTVVCGLTTDCVVTKPYVGIAALLSAGLGISSGIGLASSMGIPYSPTCITVPFLCLGLGLDGAFVLLGAWRATDDEKSVPARMARTYAHAAVSVTITTVTDVLTFMIGATIPQYAVRLFCVYMSLAVFMTFLVTITFFGSLLAIFGKLEAANRHGFTFHKLAAPSTGSKNTKRGNGCVRSCCIGCTESTRSGSQYVGISSLIFRSIYAPLLSRKLFKFLVVLGYIAYATVACIGVVQLEMDIDELRVLPNDSPIKTFREQSLEYYRYNIRIQVVFRGKYNYSDPTVRARIEEMTSRIESGPHLASGQYFTHSWLRQYDFWRAQFRSLAGDDEPELTSVSIAEFIKSDPVYKGDVVWGEDGSIEASRFFLQMVDVRNGRDLTEGITHLQAVLQEYPEFDILAYHPAFRTYELGELLPRATKETVAMAFGAMIVVAFLLIPKWSGIFVVTCSILSVQLGVVGYMTLWGVYYDLYSMVVLIMSIGFSVDFCAHTAYSFYSQKPNPGEEEKDPVEKLGIGLTHVGLPILQGTTSTVIAVVGLLLTGIYAHIMFFKVIFLIMTIGALHAIVFLPVCMLIFETFPWPPWKVFKKEIRDGSVVGDGFEPCPRDRFLPLPPSYQESIEKKNANGRIEVL